LKLLATFLIGCVGIGIALQAAMNARMGRALEAPTFGALINFVVGGTLLSLITFSGLLGRGRIEGLAEAPWWAWLGGLFGATYITTTVIAVPRIGTALVFAAVIAGQLIGALLIDSFGWLGVPRQPLSFSRALGVILLVSGVLLIQRG
jgi:transporter family-2 protein